MTAHETKNTTTPKPRNAGPPVLGFDPHEFFHFLEETGWSDEQKAEYVTLVWNIVCEFVEMGWGVHPLQQATNTCGQSSKQRLSTPSGPPDVVNSSHCNLIEEFVRRNGVGSESVGKGVIDG